MKNPTFLSTALALALTLSASPAAQSQDATPAKKPAKAPQFLGPDVPNETSVFAAPTVTRPLKVALYDGPGTGGTGVESVCRGVEMIAGSSVTKFKPDEIATADLSKFDIVVFSGGSGSAQSKAIGEKGLENVRNFVRDGGGYLGLCAGAYLATSGYPWSLGLLNAKTVSPKWKRGAGFMQMEITPDGQQKFGAVDKPFYVRYHNGPIIERDDKPNLPPYNVDVYFRTEVAENGTPVGVMKDSPAIISGNFGQGRVLSVSPHPEDSRGLENFVPLALSWLAPETAPEAAGTAEH